MNNSTKTVGCSVLPNRPHCGSDVNDVPISLVYRSAYGRNGLVIISSSSHLVFVVVLHSVLHRDFNQSHKVYVCCDQTKFHIGSVRLSVNVAEWSKAQDLGSCINLRGFKSRRLHIIFLHFSAIHKGSTEPATMNTI
jgi:hypothetical protein